jgi:hypothetical protein
MAKDGRRIQIMGAGEEILENIRGIYRESNRR